MRPVAMGKRSQKFNAAFTTGISGCMIAIETTVIGVQERVCDTTMKMRG
ncbi:MAG: hypothetical protein HY313_10190 [Acidobacteria bacterium]|nr:hypothetical protein [Acidobacteriota bacterium]